MKKNSCASPLVLPKKVKKQVALVNKHKRIGRKRGGNIEITEPAVLIFSAGNALLATGKVFCAERKPLFRAGNVFRAERKPLFRARKVFRAERKPLFRAGKVFRAEGKPLFPAGKAACKERKLRE